MVGCGRARAVIPLERDLFDALMNGPSGYRAQYYLSVDEGRAFNRALVAAMAPYLRSASRCVGQEISILGTWTKIWFAGDGKYFHEDPTPYGEFKPQRWHLRKEQLGIELNRLRAPYPENPAIEIVGTWVTIQDQHWRCVQDPLKSDRDLVLHERGGV